MFSYLSAKSLCERRKRNHWCTKASLLHENYKTETIGGLGFERPAPVILIELTICQIACSRSQNYANLIKYQHNMWGAVLVKYFPSNTVPHLEMIIGRRTLQNIILARERYCLSPDLIPLLTLMVLW